MWDVRCCRSMFDAARVTGVSSVSVMIICIARRQIPSDLVRSARYTCARFCRPCPSSPFQSISVAHLLLEKYQITSYYCMFYVRRQSVSEEWVSRTRFFFWTAAGSLVECTYIYAYSCLFQMSFHHYSCFCRRVAPRTACTDTHFSFRYASAPLIVTDNTYEMMCFS